MSFKQCLVGYVTLASIFLIQACTKFETDYREQYAGDYTLDVKSRILVDPSNGIYKDTTYTWIGNVQTKGGEDEISISIGNNRVVNYTLREDGAMLNTYGSGYFYDNKQFSLYLYRSTSQGIELEYTTIKGQRR